MYKIKPLLYLVLGLSLTACSASRSARNADDIVDDGKRNSILLSYEIRLGSYDRYPGVNSTELALRCGPGASLNPYAVCFYLRVPFEGKREVESYVFNSFEASGARVFQIKYGDYSLARATHSVVVDQRRERTCYPYRKHRRYRCYDEYVDVKADFIGIMPEPHNFTIGAGDGCYLGHLVLYMRGSKVTRFELDTTFNNANRETIFAQLPERTREKTRARVTKACSV